MICPLCGVTSLPGQRFCTECGAELPVPISGGAGPGADHEAFRPPSIDELAVPPGFTVPAAPPTVMSDIVAPTPLTVAHVPVAPVAPGNDDTVAAERPPVAVYNQALDWDTTLVPAWNSAEHTTATSGAGGPATTIAPQTVVRRGFRTTPLLVLAIIAGGCAAMAAVLHSISFDVVGDTTAAGHWRLNDFASNLLVGAIIGITLVVAGALLSSYGFKFGAGLAGGAGLALAGVFLHAVGRGTAVLDAAQVEFLYGKHGAVTLTTTREVGFYLALAAAVLAIVVFCLSLTSLTRDRIAISPVAGALGAFASIGVAIGTMLPQHGAMFGDNFSQPALPPATLYLRLAVLGLIAIGGVLGFLVSRPWGVGMALGAISIGIWQTITAVATIGNQPLPIAGGNFVASADHPFQPHIVTIIALIVAVIAVLAGLITIASQRNN